MDATQELVSEDENVTDQVNQIPQNSAQESSQELKLNNTALAEQQQEPISNEQIPNAEQSLQEKESQLSQQVVESSESQPQITNTQNISPEMENIQKEIEKVQKTISKLDGENEALKTRFQKILKKNRDLAIKLRKIDEQLDATN